MPAVGQFLRARAVEVGPDGHREAGDGRMESAVVVTAEVQVLHSAGNIGSLVGGLRDASVCGGDARYADDGQQQED